MSEHLWEKEWVKILKREEKFQISAQEKKTSVVKQTLEEKIPEKAQSTLNQAFGKAFYLVLDKGTAVIEKTYQREELEHNFKINSFALEVKNNKKTAKVFRKNANASSNKNILISGAKGASLGFLGVGVPDIPVFVSMLLKSIYEISLHYGYDYEEEKERYFILNVLAASLNYGEEWVQYNDKNNEFIENNMVPDDYDEKNQVNVVSSCLANEVLCAKFIQGIPVLGAVGGVADVVFMQRILKYAKLKYYRRFVAEKRLEKTAVSVEDSLGTATETKTHTKSHVQKIIEDFDNWEDV